MKEEYMLPIRVKIEADDPDKVSVALARAIYDAAKGFLLEDNASMEVDYSVFKKPDPATFGK